MASGSHPGYGYVSLLGLKPQDPIRILKRIERGFDFKTIEEFQRRTQLSTEDLADLVAIKLRTLHRRKEQGRLGPDESDRLLRASRVFGKALALFEGDGDAARDWLFSPAKALGGVQPIAMARTDLGAREVEALVDRLEYGVLG